MTIQQHEICLESDQDFDGRLPTHHLGFLLADLPVAIRGAVSMALRNRSKTPGKQPSWLKRASDLRFTGHSGNGVTHLQFELPSLQEAANEVYAQQEFFDSGRPDGKLTGLDLLMRVVRDIDAVQTDSDAFDPQLLHQFARFKRFFKSGPFSGFRMAGSTPETCGDVRVTLETTENSVRLYSRTPTPQRVRLVGDLDGMEASTQRFSLLLDSGERVSGVYPEEISDQLQELSHKRVLVLGTSVFRASGNLLRVEAESIDDGTNASSVFSTPPVASGSRLDASRLRKPQGTRSGMAAIMGRWPGDETEEEIAAALEHIL
ncbi:MAG: hypothetical protein O3A00_06100 [Planctomycetota bacterium]|nr:hypothetical protein [Planctomycetota bacterium]